jgi:probable F420-dependent oxidoreductase
MRFMYQHPEFIGPDGDLTDVGPAADLARTAEAAGWEGFAFTEHPVPGAKWLSAGGHQTLDPFVALGHVAAVTARLRLLTYLAVVPYRNPNLLAKAAASVDKLSGGRFILGVGTGYHKAEFFALGVDFEERNALFDEALEVLPLHWSGEPFSYRGRHFEARDVIARPRPVQDPIPIWIGGNAKLTLRRVAERAQGWMPLFAPPAVVATSRTPGIADTADLAQKIRQLRDDAGPRGADLDVCVPYLEPSIAAPKADVGRHRDAFAELEAAGVTWIAIEGKGAAPPDTLRWIEDFADTYLR